MGGRGGASGITAGGGFLGEKYESIFESGRKRVSYKEAMQEYGREYVVKGTYNDGEKTIEVEPSPLTAKIMQITPKEYLEANKSALYPEGTKARAADLLVESIRNDIGQGVTPPKEAPKWYKDAYRYTQAADAMRNVYGNKKYDKQNISDFNARIKKYGNEKGYADEMKKLRKKLKSLGF